MANKTVDGWLSKLSVSTKILASLVLALLVGMAITTYVLATKSSKTAGDLAIDNGKLLAEGIASRIQRDINPGFRIVETVRDTFIAMQNKGITDRSLYLSFIEEVKKANPQVLAVWTAWEPNALDGHDAEFVNKPGYDATGRFVPYVANKADSSGFDVTPLTDYDKPGPGDYYLLARNSGKPHLIEPYPYQIGSKKVLMTSLVTPIVIDGKVKGVVGLDINLESLQDDLAKIKPYGTGAVSLISHGGNWAAFEQTDKITKPIDEANAELAEAKSAVIAGKSTMLTGYSKLLQTPVYRLLQPVSIGQTDTPWSVLVALPQDKIAQPSKDLTSFIIIASAILIVMMAGFIAFLVRMLVARPLAGLTSVVGQLAEGNTAVTVPSTDRGDELGTMAKAIDFFRQKLIEIEALRQRTELAEKDSAESRRRAMLELADNFEDSVGEIMETVASSATELQAAANSLTTTANHTQELSTMVASSAEEASTNVQSVAAASEEMSSTIVEISRQVQNSSQIADRAVAQAESTDKRVNELAEAARKIGDVVELITNIAEQTNLLALNATIEAARAGDAGRGFAVVASEVKSLAEQTAKATGEIGHQIGAIQEATGTSVTAIREISKTIEQMSEISTAIAAAIEEQGAATNEISRNVQEASRGTNAVATSIADVKRGSSETGSASAQVLSSADMLSVESNRLKTEVQKFLATVRAA